MTTKHDVENCEIHSRCVGCYAPMIYVGEVTSYGAPFFEPKESHAVQHAHGHLCASCVGHVETLFKRLREDRRRLKGKQ